LRAQREGRVEVEPGKFVRFLRPAETEFVRVIGGVTADHVCEYVCGWDGFSEADLLGASVGANEPATFSADAWAEYARDRVEVVSKVAQAIADAITLHLQQRSAAGKN
jgi:hypothetical protein